MERGDTGEASGGNPTCRKLKIVNKNQFKNNF
jgi:hypothetical protein